MIATSASLFAFGLTRLLFPDNTPDVGQLLRTPGPYFRDQLPYLAGWTFAVVALATALAYFGGRYFPRVEGGVAYESAWWRVFKNADEYETFVGCELIDGTYVGGTLWTYNATLDETGDRDIALVAPITYRASDAATPVVLDDVSIVTLSASRMKFMTVTYFNKPT